MGAGTGQFTRVLAEVADHVVAVDSSPEMLELNPAKVPAPTVDRVVGDVFEWQPAHRAKLVVMGFLLSHIPRVRLPGFWEAVKRMLAPGGQLFVMDEARDGVWREEESATADVVYRTLSDGRRFRIVKVLWDPVDLEERLSDLGWAAQLERHDPFFWGTIRPRRAVRAGPRP